MACILTAAAKVGAEYIGHVKDTLLCKVKGVICTKHCMV